MPICAGENMRQLATAGVERERAQQYRADVPQPRAGRLQPLADTAPRGRRRRRGVWRGPPGPGRRAGGAVALVLARRRPTAPPTLPDALSAARPAAGGRGRRRVTWCRRRGLRLAARERGARRRLVHDAPLAALVGRRLPDRAAT